ncbi:hypothetical protein LB505_001283 [Fusarium chuoi]|nr:hypothetical protein LB505_001283 [Fusarium chuoi]
MTHDGTMIEVSHFPETGKVILLEALVALLEPSESLAESRGSKDSFFQVIMIDQDKEDVPGKVEAYMRDVFQLFIDREPSKFMRSYGVWWRVSIARGSGTLLKDQPIRMKSPGASKKPKARTMLTSTRPFACS